MFWNPFGVLAAGIRTFGSGRSQGRKPRAVFWNPFGVLAALTGTFASVRARGTKPWALGSDPLAALRAAIPALVRDALNHRGTATPCRAPLALASARAFAVLCVALVVLALPAAADEAITFPGYAAVVGGDSRLLSGLSVAGRPILTGIRPRCFAPKDRDNGIEEIPLRADGPAQVTRGEVTQVRSSGSGTATVAGIAYSVRFSATLRCRPEGVVDIEVLFRSDRDAYVDCGVFLTFDRAAMGIQPVKAVTRGGAVEERKMDPGLPQGVTLNYYGHDLQRCEASTPLGLPLAMAFPPGMTLQAWEQGYAWDVWNAAQKYWAFSWGKPRVWRRWAAGREYPVRFRLVLPVEGAAQAAARLPLAGQEEAPANPFAPDLEALRKDPARRTGDAPWLARVKPRSAELARLAGETTTDAWERPAVDRGTFRVGGKWRYLVGPWLGSNFSVDGRFNTSEFARGDALIAGLYSRPMDRELADGIGFGTGHPDLSPVYSLQQLGAQSGRSPGQTHQERTDCMAALLEGMKGLPMVVEVIPGALRDIASKRFPAAPLRHENPGWYEFVPLNFAHPDARRLYTEMFQSAARMACASGGNVFLYELFNEPVYDSFDPETRARFGAWAQETYGSIERANAVWGTRFPGFAEAAASKDLRDGPGLWVDWLKHNSREWCAGLREFAAAIRTVDRRPGVRFAVQPAVAFTYETLRGGNNAIDLWQQAQVTDAITVEGGYSFGGDPPKVGGDREEMLAYVNAGPLSLPYYLDVSRALAEDRKPVTDHELNITRYAFGERVPTRRTDFPTALWSELVHGCSLDILYSWDRRGWEWQDMAGAYQMVRTPSYKSSCLLNPYAYPPDSLYGIRDFRQEVDALADLALPMPRTRNRVAILFSSPSLRMDSLRPANFGPAMTGAHSALLYAHHPADFLFEEQLADRARSGRYGAIVLPCATHVMAETPRHLEAYVRAGGTVIAFAGALRKDEYDRPLQTPLLGLQATDLPVLRPVRLAPLPGTTVPLPHLEVEAHESLALKEAVALARSDDGQVLVAKRTLGRGRVYTIAGRASGVHLSALLEGILADAGVRRAANVVAKDGGYVPNVEVECIDRGDRKLLFLLNWSAYTPQEVRIALDGAGPWRVSDALTRKPLAGDLKAAIHLEPQVRRLLLLERLGPLPRQSTRAVDSHGPDGAAGRNGAACRAT